MTCAKKHVTCTIISDHGKFTGTNACRNPQEVCPRTKGEDFTKCREICDQEGHAEIMALKASGKCSEGSYAIIRGIGHICRHCQEALVEAGVRWFMIGENYDAYNACRDIQSINVEEDDPRVRTEFLRRKVDEITSVAPKAPVFIHPLNLVEHPVFVEGEECKWSLWCLCGSIFFGYCCYRGFMYHTPWCVVIICVSIGLAYGDNIYKNTDSFVYGVLTGLFGDKSS